MFPVHLSSPQIRDGVWHVTAQFRDFDDNVQFGFEFDFPFDVTFISPMTVRVRIPETEFPIDPEDPDAPQTDIPGDRFGFYFLRDSTCTVIADITPEQPFDTPDITHLVLKRQLQTREYVLDHIAVQDTLENRNLYDDFPLRFDPIFDIISPDVTTIVVQLADVFGVSSIKLSEAARAKQIMLQRVIKIGEIETLADFINPNINPTP